MPCMPQAAIGILPPNKLPPLEPSISTSIRLNTETSVALDACA